MQYFKSFDGEKIAYKINHQPSNSKNSIVIVHGLGGDIALLENFIQELIEEKDDLEIISLALRGHSFSSKIFPKSDHYLEEVHAKDLRELLIYLNLKSPILIGHSLGGIIIQSYLNQDLLPKAKKIFFICASTQTLGIDIFRKFSYKILTKTPNHKEFHTKSKSFYDKFKNTWDIDFKRFIYDTSVIGGLFIWFLHFFSIHGWRNKDLKKLDEKHYYYILGKNDIIIPKIKQLYRLRNLNRINKIEINSGHIIPITNHKILAKNIIKHI